MPSPQSTSDDSLTIALAEYSQLNEAKRVASEQSASRFNFFLAVATAVAAVTAGVLAGGQDTAAQQGAIGALAALLLAIGVTTFFRQVEFSVRGQQYTAAQTVLRTYLAQRAEDLRPYLLTSTVTDRGLFTPVALRNRASRDAVGLAALVGLINSALMGLAAGLAMAAQTGGWLPVLIAIAVFATGYALHLWWIRRGVRRMTERIANVLAQRGLLDVDQETGPADDPSTSGTE